MPPNPVAELNDRFRRELILPDPDRTISGMATITCGIKHAFRIDEQQELLRRIAHYSDFYEDHDPWGGTRFRSLELQRSSNLLEERLLRSISRSL